MDRSTIVIFTITQEKDRKILFLWLCYLYMQKLQSTKNPPQRVFVWCMCLGQRECGIHIVCTTASIALNSSVAGAWHNQVALRQHYEFAFGSSVGCQRH
jgi:hypothetical protein